MTKLFPYNKAGKKLFTPNAVYAMCVNRGSEIIIGHIDKSTLTKKYF